MNSLEKLTQLVCEVDSIKKDIMQPRFGTKVRYSPDKGHIINTYLISYKLDRISLYNNNLHPKIFRIHEFYKKYNGEIIGNNLEDYHLRKYCEIKGIHYWLKYNELTLFTSQNKRNFILDLQPLYKQKEEVIEDLFAFLSNLKNENVF